MSGKQIKLYILLLPVFAVGISSGTVELFCGNVTLLLVVH